MKDCSYACKIRFIKLCFVYILYMRHSINMIIKRVCDLMILLVLAGHMKFNRTIGDNYTNNLFSMKCVFN